MSKKKKFKKFSRAEIIAEIQKTSSTSAQPTAQAINNDSASKKPVNIDAKSQNYGAEGVVGAESSYVSADLKKIAVIFSIILLLLVGIIYIDKNTPILTDFIDTLVKNLNINQ